MIVLHLPWPPSVNSANGLSRRGYYPRKQKEKFFQDAGSLYMTQKRALMKARLEGPFTYHLILNNALRTSTMDGDNRGKYPLDFAQRVGLIENDKLAEGGSWSWGNCEHGAMLSIHPVSVNRVSEASPGQTNERQFRR